MKKIDAIPWYYWIIGIDFFFILITFVASYRYVPYSWNFFLGHERTIGTWWSGICLLSLALLSYELFSMKKDATKTAWLALSFLFLALSWDEIGSFHERVGDWSVLWKFAVIGGICLAYSLIILFRTEETRRSGWLIMIGFILFASVALQERLEHTINWPYRFEGVRVTVEEGTELLGMLICFAGIASQKRNMHGFNSWKNIIPDPAKMKLLYIALFLGLLCQLVASVFTQYLSDLHKRGNPAVWYPSAIYYLLFCLSVWKSYNFDEKKRKYWLSFAVCSLIFSIAVVAKVHTLRSSELFSNFYSFNLFLLPFLIFFYVRIFDKISVINVFVFTCLATMMLLGYVALSLKMIENVSFIQYFTTGIFAFYIVKLYMLDLMKNHGIKVVPSKS